jgi:predicted phage baseplate assembly protein
MATIVIPDFPFSSHFYPEHLEDLVAFLRVNAPELTDEDPAEPHIQIIRAQALSFHLSSAHLDLVANEMFLPTAKLRSSHKALLALIDVALKQASPASVDLLAQLSQTFTASKVTVPKGSLFSTLETRAAQAVEFEALADVDILDRTDQVGYVYAYDATADAYTDHSAEAKTTSGSFTPAWGAAVANNDALYIGHRGVIWDKTRFNVATGSTNITIGVWEYYDGSFDQGVPSSVTNLGSTLRFNVNSILGTADRTGTKVRVRSAITGAFQDLTVTFASGENRITTSGADAFLGQSSPSTNVQDYIVGSEWRELSGLTDATTRLSVVGTALDVSYTLPQSLTQNWRKATVGSGMLAVSAYWLRFRVITVGGGPTAPAINEVRISDGKQYQVFSTTQGRSRTDNPLASSDGTPDQEYTLANFPVIDDSNLSVIVNEGGTDKTYTRVDNFLNSLPTDRHFRVEFEDDGSATIFFGNGTNGKIPPAGVNNIRASYRTMDEVDGNVGAQTITVNRSGVAFLANVTNPRGAAGFGVREGSTDEDLARLKLAGPATLRTRQRAVSTEDVETLAADFVAADGSKPVKRALAIEEAFGPKTVEAVVVGAGGAAVDASKLQEVEDFFNGAESVRGRLVMNHECTVTNFTQKVINVTATVYGGNQTAVETALKALLNPLAKKSDGTYVWAFGGSVPLARLYQEVMNTSPPPRNVTFTVPTGDTSLAQRELPVAGTLSITVVA